MTGRPDEVVQGRTDPGPAAEGPRGAASRGARTDRTLFAAVSFLCGLHFAVLQFSYFFLMEAYLSSQYLSYFISLFFWLCGFLVGLFFPRRGWLPKLLLLGTGAYYGAWALARIAPFHPMLYPSAAICSVVSGMGPGYFFPFMARRLRPIRSPLFHENNGFILGILVSLRGSIYFGSSLIAYGPLLGALLVCGLLLVGDGLKESSGARRAGPTGETS